MAYSQFTIEALESYLDALADEILALDPDDVEAGKWDEYMRASNLLCQARGTK